jgi:hypothetical protein
MAQLIETQQQSLAFHFSAPNFSAIISANVRFLAEKWDQLLSIIVSNLLSRWDIYPDFSSTQPRPSEQGILSCCKS